MSAGGVTFALYITRTGTLGADAATATRYFHHDHLGSVVAVSDETGAVIERLAYDPWGKRRHVNGQADPLDAIVGVNTERGYTMHEHLDEIGVIHMNGRIYDPLIGRFMSADPFIQSADNLQSYNRYAYVMNNPLAYTDPSGYFSWKKVFRVVVTIAVAYYTGQWVGDNVMWALAPTSANAAAIGAIAGGAAGGFAGGALMGGSLKAGVQGALSGGLFGWAGNIGAADSFARYAAHAAAGCVGSEVGGGDCGSGALSAVVGKYTTNEINATFGPEPSPGKFVAVTIAGGTASVIGGGKFDNGATTAAFGYLFNYCMHDPQRCYLKQTGERFIDGIRSVFKSTADLLPASGGANAAGGGEVTAMVGFAGVSFGAGKAIDTNQNICTVMQGCVMGGWGLYVGAEGTGQAAVGSLSTGSMDSIGLFGKGGLGPSASVTPLQVNADRTISGQVGAGVGAGFGAGVKVCKQVTTCP